MDDDTEMKNQREFAMLIGRRTDELRRMLNDGPSGALQVMDALAILEIVGNLASLVSNLAVILDRERA